MTEPINLTQLRAEIESDNVPYVIPRQAIAALIDTAEAAIEWAHAKNNHQADEAYIDLRETLNHYTHTP